MLIPSSYCSTDDQCPAASERSPCYAQLIDIEVEPASQLSLALEQNAHLKRLDRCFRNCPGYLRQPAPQRGRPARAELHLLAFTRGLRTRLAGPGGRARPAERGRLAAGREKRAFRDLPGRRRGLLSPPAPTARLRRTSAGRPCRSRSDISRRWPAFARRPG